MPGATGGAGAPEPEAGLGRRELASGATVGDREDRDRRQATGAWAPRLFVASIVAAAVPIVVATVRALDRGWIPIGDDALFKIRALDVFGRHLPLLGSWSSGSVTTHVNVNHPGPLLYDLLAVPVAVLGGPTGSAVGIAALNVAAVVGIAWFAFRRGGPVVGALAMVAATALSWAMGSELLFEPWPPHSMLLPFLFFVVLVWSMTCGDALAAPFAIGVGSLVLQSHLSYALLVPLLAAWGLAGAAWSLRRDRLDASRWPGRRREVGRVATVTGLVFVACWMQPLIEQLTSSGQGNLSRLASVATDSNVRTVGFRTGALLVASVNSLPPFWLRPSLNQTFYLDQSWTPPSLGLALGSLAALALVVAGAGWDGRRRRDPLVTRAVSLAAIGVLVGFVTAARNPVDVFGPYTPHQWRFLWPLGTFLFFAVALALVRRLETGPAMTARLVGAATLVAVLLAALNLPNANLADGPNSQEYAIPVAKELDARLGVLKGRGPLLVDGLFESFAVPYGAMILDELQRRGIDFVVHNPQLVRHLGPEREFPGSPARAVLLLRTGVEALTPPPGTRAVARAEGMSRSATEAFARARALVESFLASPGLALTPRGTAALQRGRLPRLRALLADPRRDTRPLIESGELVSIVLDGDLALDPTWSKRFARYATLQTVYDRETAALFLGPVGRR